MTFPEIKRKDVDGFLFASSYCGRNPFQVNAAPVMAGTQSVLNPLTCAAGLIRFAPAQFVYHSGRRPG